jgi:hypothetical protein
LNAAYFRALRSLSLIDRNDPITEMLARKIIEIGATETDPEDFATRCNLLQVRRLIAGTVRI